MQTKRSIVLLILTCINLTLHPTARRNEELGLTEEIPLPDDDEGGYIPYPQDDENDADFAIPMPDDEEPDIDDNEDDDDNADEDDDHHHVTNVHDYPQTMMRPPAPPQGLLLPPGVRAPPGFAGLPPPRPSLPPGFGVSLPPGTYAYVFTFCNRVQWLLMSHALMST
jgi:hypothetical protein